MYDINVGDTVYIQKRVRYGFSLKRVFEVPAKVTRTTKTQFEVGGKKYWKKNLSLVGGSSFQGCSLEGKDQTKEMKAFKTKLDKIQKLRGLIQDLNDGRGLHHKMPSSSIEYLTNAIEKFLKETNNGQ